MTKYVGAAEFKAKCLKLIDEMQADGEPITITKRGKPVATMSVIKEEKQPLKPLFGMLKGSVLKYEDPFEPAPSDHADRHALFRYLFGRDQRADHAAHRIAIGDAQRGHFCLGGCLEQLFGGRGAAQKGKVRRHLKFGIGHWRRVPM